MTVHVIGAGLAGLAAAVRLADAGCPVVLHEKVRQAGGRCRSFFDPRLGRTVDYGIHLTFADLCPHLHAYLAEIGATDRLIGPDRAACDFFDTDSGERWRLEPNAGRLPWWMVAATRRIPGSRPADYLALARLALAGPQATVADIMPRHGSARRRFWEPVCIAALNTAPAHAQARSLWTMLRGRLAGGEAVSRPRFVRRDLSRDLVAPALRRLAERGAELHLGHRLIGLDIVASRVAALAFADASVPLGRDDAVILAVPPATARRLLPGLAAPRADSAIVTAHYVLTEALAPEPILTTLIDRRPLWLLTRGDLASVTVGAADDLLGMHESALARLLWRPVAASLRRDPASLPPHRVLRFRHGTFAHSPAGMASRPAARNGWSNLFLAGDWTRTGQAATLDGAVQSGHAAAASVLCGPIGPAEFQSV